MNLSGRNEFGEGQIVVERKKLEEIFARHSFTDFRWVDARNIVVSQWVRMKCMFGCMEYGKSACCPPNVPSVAECERFFRDYKEAAIFHFEKIVDKPEDRYAWTRHVNTKLWKLERDVFLAGYQKAFLLYMDTCYLCKDCSGARAQCLNKRMARPTPEAFGLDVFSTVKQVGYSIEVLYDYSQKMNRYAFIMIE
jgi:predicted metal-binding protein